MLTVEMVDSGVRSVIGVGLKYEGLYSIASVMFNFARCSFLGF